MRATDQSPKSLPEIFDGLKADEAKTKYGCLKLMRGLSEQKPAALYPGIDRLFELLSSENKFIKWGATICIGNLAAVDSSYKIDKMLARYLQPIPGPVMITAANVVHGAGKIAQAKPHLAGKIARALLQVESATYQTEECRNVVIGHAIEAFGLFFKHLKKPNAVVGFVARQIHNRRSAVRKKAARFLKRHAVARASDG